MEALAAAAQAALFQVLREEIMAQIPDARTAKRRLVGRLPPTRQEILRTEHYADFIDVITAGLKAMPATVDPRYLSALIIAGHNRDRLRGILDLTSAVVTARFESNWAPREAVAFVDTPASVIAARRRLAELTPAALRRRNNRQTAANKGTTLAEELDKDWQAAKHSEWWKAVEDQLEAARWTMVLRVPGGHWKTWTPPWD
jgi:hypothetical protein